MIWVFCVVTVFENFGTYESTGLGTHLTQHSFSDRSIQWDHERWSPANKKAFAGQFAHRCFRSFTLPYRKSKQEYDVSRAFHRKLASLSTCPDQGSTLPTKVTGGLLHRIDTGSQDVLVADMSYCKRYVRGGFGETQKWVK